MIGGAILSEILETGYVQVHSLKEHKIMLFLGIGLV